MVSMNVLIIGAGGREHALAWKIAQSPRAGRVFCAPGNTGTALVAQNVNIAATDFPKLIKFAKDNDVGLTVVGPEIPLVLGITDAFLKAGLKVFGPSMAAAELEGSKVFCKDLLRNADVPTADYRVFRSVDRAITFLREREDVPVVVKADGLAAGKGVVVCSGRAEALDAVERIGKNMEFGDAGKQIVIEERLDGREVSVLALTDGQTIVTLPPAQDHKRAYDGDTGPNTGGMGAYSPAPIVDDAMMRWIEAHVLVPTVHAMKRARRPFRGVLYAGLMITNQGPKVLEYNVRFGDPECQPLMLRLKSDLLELLLAVAEGKLDEIEPPQWDERPAVCVVMAAEGYPGNYAKGKPIRGLEEAAKVSECQVFHAGTAAGPDGQVVTDGGRVLGVTALGNSIQTAKLQAYTAVKAIRWDGAWCRKDISDKAMG
ncbi:MAG: phosphoribosylamine--glycine ligase [Planctomycetia bacterium]|nr:phosphoribosylamine--glycine ligase [Planctomycetia bacterium]